MPKGGKINRGIFDNQSCHTDGRSSSKNGIDERELTIMSKREHQQKSTDTDENDKAHKNDFNILRLRGKSLLECIMRIISTMNVWINNEVNKVMKLKNLK